MNQTKKKAEETKYLHLKHKLKLVRDLDQRIDISIILKKA
jgi:hypothetical protein